MKKKLLVVGLIVALMVSGLVLMGCANPCELEKGGCSYSVNRYGEVSINGVCANTSCRVAKDIKDQEEKPGSCDCK